MCPTLLSERFIAYDAPSYEMDGIAEKPLLLSFLVALVFLAGCLGSQVEPAGEEESEDAQAEGDPDKESYRAPIQEEHLEWAVGICSSPGAMGGASSGIDHDQVVLHDEAEGHPFEASFSGQSGPHATFEVAFYDDEGQGVGHEASDMFGTSLQGTVPADAYWAIFYTCGATQVEATFLVLPA